MQRMELYYIINYYIKYVELLDTLYLALKKRSFGLYCLGIWCADGLLTRF